MRRITITIPPDVLAGAEEQAEREGLSVSAWLSQAAAREVRRAAGLVAAAELLDEIDGWPTVAEAAELDREFDTALARARPGGRPGEVA